MLDRDRAIAFFKNLKLLNCNLQCGGIRLTMAYIVQNRTVIYLMCICIIIITLTKIYIYNLYSFVKVKLKSALKKKLKINKT